MEYIKIQADITEDNLKNHIKWLVSNVNLAEDELIDLLDKAYKNTTDKFKIQPNDPYFYSISLGNFKKLIIDKVCDGKGIDCKLMLENKLTSYRD